MEELDVLYEHFSQPEIEWPKSRYPVEFRTTEQITSHAQSLADLIYQRCEARLPTFVVNGGAYQDRESFDGVWTPSHINPFIRFVKGGDGGKHAAHVDGIIRKCYDEMSFLSIVSSAATALSRIGCASASCASHSSLVLLASPAFSSANASSFASSWAAADRSHQFPTPSRRSPLQQSKSRQTSSSLRQRRPSQPPPPQHLLRRLPQ